MVFFKDCDDLVFNDFLIISVKINNNTKTVMELEVLEYL